MKVTFLFIFYKYFNTTSISIDSILQSESKIYIFFSENDILLILYVVTNFANILPCLSKANIVFGTKAETPSDSLATRGLPE